MKVLQFSGGKDSLACLYLLEKDWEDIVVAWVNTGKAFQETIELMENIRGMVPNFVEINTDQQSQNETYGWPVDVLPVRNDLVVQNLTGIARRPLQSFLKCCAENIMFPMHRWVKDNGYKTIIRGQKNTDHHKSKVRHGDVYDGVEYLFPIQDWDDKQVYAYLSDKLPKHYAFVNTSLDCWDCTAYLAENVGKFKYMQKFHPDKYETVKRRVIEIKNIIHEDSKFIDEVIYGA